LRSDRLKAEICEPGEGRNRTVRFDRAAFVVSVELDGSHEFCAEEPDNLRHPCSGGAGLCSEIQAEGLWESTPVGARCPKFGVGFVEKPDGEPYRFFDISYDVEPFDIVWTADGGQAAFRTEARPCGGYALRQTKMVTLEGNSIAVGYEFQNVGKEPLLLSEYVHNFLTIDRHPIGPDYYLGFPTAALQDGKRARRETATIRGVGKGFGYSGYSSEAASIALEKDEIDPGRPFSWHLTHSGSALGVSEEDSFIPDRVNVWTIDRIVSPEVFHRFALAPGEAHSYNRRWTFSDRRT
jgi:hypothetical protein